MAVGGLGPTELILILTVLLLFVGAPIVLIVALVLFFNRRKNSTAGMKKCGFCGYSIPVEGTVCQSCSREQ